jgi:hypothetical protein
MIKAAAGNFRPAAVSPKWRIRPSRLHPPVEAFVMNSMRAFPGIALAFLLGACSSGGGSTPPAPPPTPAPSGLSYPAPPVLTKGTAIATLTPTVTGAPTSYTVNPALPAGLTLNATSGVVSGTPTAVQAATNHTVTASNAGGNTTATLAITVRDLPPAISYPRTSYRFTTEVALAPVAPTSTGGAVVSWALDRALPAGLAFSTTTGQISGTPTAATAASNYRVTATNSGGTATYDFAIDVISGLVLDLGETDGIVQLLHDGTRILSASTQGHVILWNAQSGAKVLSVTANCVADSNCVGNNAAQLAGQVLVVRTNSGFDLYAAATGLLQAHIDSASSLATPWKLSVDGSYIVEYSATELRAWSSAGAAITSRPGKYDLAKLYAAAGEIRIANGAAGTQVIETVALPAGTGTTSPTFTGVFDSWFADGERFVSVLNQTAIVYSRLAVQAAITASPREIEATGGSGDWFWLVNFDRAYTTFYVGEHLSIYSVSAPATPAADYIMGEEQVPSIAAIGNKLAFASNGGRNYLGAPTINIVDLAGAAPVRTEHVARAGSISRVRPLATGGWLFGNRLGVVMGASTPLAEPQIYSLGRVLSVAGSPTRASVATASGQILNFDATTRTLENQIAFSASQLALSNDGQVLGALGSTAYDGGWTERTLKVFALPNRNLITEFPSTYDFSNGAYLTEFGMSADGNVITQSIEHVTTTPPSTTRHTDCESRVLRTDGTAIWSATQDCESVTSRSLIRLSPSGTRFAVADTLFRDTTVTNLYQNGVLTGVTTGMAGGWLDDSRLLVLNYVRSQAPVSLYDVYTSSKIVDTLGQTLSPLVVPPAVWFQALAADRIYSPQQNEIFDVSSGASAWSTPTPSTPMADSIWPYPTHVGAVAGDFVYFPSGHTLRAEPR